MQKAVHVGCLALWLRPMLALSDQSSAALDSSYDARICDTCGELLRDANLQRKDAPVWVDVGSK